MTAGSAPAGTPAVVRPRRWRVAVVGAGAIGGFVGARLALAGHEVSVFARGATLAALREHGLRLEQGGVRTPAPLAAASDEAARLGAQDLVIVAVKGPSMAAVAPAVGTLCGEGTVVLPAVNGVPWWFTQGLEGVLGAEPLAHVDPGGHIAAVIPAAAVLGGVVHVSAATAEPGLVVHRNGRGLIVGEPSGGASERSAAVVALLADAGFDATASDHIRRDAWYKLWGNLTMNPVSALTGATADQVLDDPLVRALCSAAMREAAAIGERIGCRIDQRPEDRHAVTRRLGAFRTSMLQDAEAGRPLELDAIVGAVHEMGRRLSIPTPAIDGLFGLARLFGRVRGLYPKAPEEGTAA
jgi:2-dehydropantoate 2-reductase